jgi:hypothetical protein
MRKAVSLLLASLLAACALVESSVTTFHTLPAKAEGETLAIYPGSAELRSSLEHRAYLAKLAQHFQAAGYQVVDFDGPQQPDYVAIFAYGIDSGSLVTKSFAVPQWGVTGYSGATTTGTMNTYGNTGTYTANTTLTPQYGITGYQTGTTTERVYQRAILLSIYDTAMIDPDDSHSFDKAKVYEGRLASEGACGSMAALMDPLLNSLFKDFPGESGKSRKFQMPTSPNTC